MDGDYTERLPQESECRENGESGILESASTFAQRVLEEIEALAGTTSCKGVQIARLKSSIPSSLRQGREATTHTTVYRLAPADNLVKNHEP